MRQYVRFLMLWLLLGAAALFIRADRNLAIAPAIPLELFPMDMNGWRMCGENRIPVEAVKDLRLTDYLSRDYLTSDGRRVSLYVGYHGEGGLHTPRHCLPGSGWQLLHASPAELQGGHLNLVRAVYEKEGNREMFLYWFQIRGKTVASEYTLKLHEIRNSLLYSRCDEALVRVSVPFGGDEREAAALGERFLNAFYPVICRHLPS